MSENIPEAEAPSTFYKWEKLLDELRRHTLSFFDKDSLRNYSQCSKRSNEEVQKYDTKNPLVVNVKDLQNSRVGVMVTLEYKERVKEDRSFHIIDIDVVEELIERYAEEGNVDAAGTARQELVALKAEKNQLEADDYDKKLTRIAARLVNVVEVERDPHQLVEHLVMIGRIRMDHPIDVDILPHLMPDLGEEGNRVRNFEHFQEEVADRMGRELFERGYRDIRALRGRRQARLEREASERRIDMSFVAVGPNKHKMIQNRPSELEDGILEGNAVDAAYEYLAKRFDSRKIGQIREITLDVRKWPTKFMESEAIQQGVAKWEVTMYRTIYEEFMQHMRMDTNPKNIKIKPGNGMGYQFKLPSDIFTVFHDGDSLSMECPCHISDDELLRNTYKSLYVLAGTITDKGINAMIRQLMDTRPTVGRKSRETAGRNERVRDTTITRIWIRRSSKLNPERRKLDKTVILDDLPFLPQEFHRRHRPNEIRCADGSRIEVEVNTGECQINVYRDDDDDDDDEDYDDDDFPIFID